MIPGKSDGIELTIGVATLNEAKTIGAALNRLLEEMKSWNSELVVVAGGDDGTKAVVADKLKGRKNTRMIEDSRPRGKPAALNMILEVAKGRIIVLSDGDVVVRRGSILELVKPFADDSVGAVSARGVGIAGKPNLVESVSLRLAEIMHRARLAEQQETGSLTLATGYLIAVRRDLFPVVPENSNSDDGYISAWVRSKGKRIAYASDAVVEIRFPKTVSDFLLQRSRNRYGHMQTARSFPGLRSRSFSAEITDFVRRGGPAGGGPAVFMSSAVLVFLTWVLAFARLHFPWLYKRPVWVAINSTKG